MQPPSADHRPPSRRAGNTRRSPVRRRRRHSPPESTATRKATRRSGEAVRVEWHLAGRSPHTRAGYLISWRPVRGPTHCSSSPARRTFNHSSQTGWPDRRSASPWCRSPGGDPPVDADDSLVHALAFDHWHARMRCEILPVVRHPKVEVAVSQLVQREGQPVLALVVIGNGSLVREMRGTRMPVPVGVPNCECHSSLSVNAALPELRVVPCNLTTKRPYVSEREVVPGKRAFLDQHRDKY